MPTRSASITCCALALIASSASPNTRFVVPAASPFHIVVCGTHAVDQRGDMVVHAHAAHAAATSRPASDPVASVGGQERADKTGADTINREAPCAPEAQHRAAP